MKEKIEEILARFGSDIGIYDIDNFNTALKELSTLIQQEREEAYEKVLQEVRKVSKELPAEIERTNPDYRQGMHAGLDLAIDIILTLQSLDKGDVE